MSHEIVKYITFNEKEHTVKVACSSNNVMPKTYTPFMRVKPEDGEEAYEAFKREFAGWVFDGSVQFMPSCQSKAKKALGDMCDKMADAHKKFWDYLENEDLYREDWIEAYLEALNYRLTHRENGRSAA